MFNEKVMYLKASIISNCLKREFVYISMITIPDIILKVLIVALLVFEKLSINLMNIFKKKSYLQNIYFFTGMFKSQMKSRDLVSNKQGLRKLYKCYLYKVLDIWEKL